MPIGRGLEKGFSALAAGISKGKENKAEREAFELWRDSPQGKATTTAYGLDNDISKQKFDAFIKYSKAAGVAPQQQAIQQQRDARMQMSMGRSGFVPSTPDLYAQSMGRGEQPISIPGVGQYVKPPTAPKHSYSNLDSLAKKWVKEGNIHLVTVYERFKALGMSPEEILKKLVKEHAIDKKEAKKWWVELAEFFD